MKTGFFFSLRGFIVLVGIFCMNSLVLFAAGSQEPAVITVRADGMKEVNVGKLSFAWKFIADRIEVELQADTTGYVSVGFNPDGAMNNANLILVYVKDGQTFFSDDYGISPFAHKPDTEFGGMNNVTSISGRETNGRTTVRFSIPVDSKDKYDSPLQEGKEVNLIFAYGRNESDNFSDYHAWKGKAKLVL